jgi:hypothetical protein
MYGLYKEPGPTRSMRKVIVEVCPKDPMMVVPAGAPDLVRLVKRFEETVESVILLELLKLDFERGEKALVCEITMKEGYTLEDLDYPETLGSVQVLKAEGRTYTCFCTCAVRDEFLLQKMRDFDLDVIWTAPIYKSRDSIIYSCIGNSENLNRVLRLMSTYGEIRNVAFEQPSFSSHDILSHLTPRQRDLLIAAKRCGYYDYPRRITGSDLAEKVGVSKATAIEHLRRAEARLISILLQGY